MILHTAPHALTILFEKINSGKKKSINSLLPLSADWAAECA
jgi:hypothetical protein